ncbi:hypothetical protein F6X40_34505 [Paraburkholderia sp. UCT31]|uniref:hypothetical protein n=1 Tax=Paraburkholderia sp. UCT31 TaxID=2615209 RepID=UPI001656624A|nr:hypothetical protein [Paraburkholderia sp. UCT31]MBC8741675.1 hypothetical protein [Paraburkholderia sp. UCT31]
MFKDVKEVKTAVRILRATLKELGPNASSMSHNDALHLIARMVGKKTYMELEATLPGASPTVVDVAKNRIIARVQLEDDDAVFELDVTDWFEQAEDYTLEFLWEVEFDFDQAAGDEKEGMLEFFLAAKAPVAIEVDAAIATVGRMFPGAVVGWEWKLDYHNVMAWIAERRPRLEEEIRRR